MYPVEEDVFVKCPFDPNHVMKSYRLVTHIVRCKKRHPQMKLKECPYNWTHLYKEEDLVEHLEVCRDKRLIERSRRVIQLSEESSVSHEHSDTLDEGTHGFSSYVYEPLKPRTSIATEKEKNANDYGWICYEKGFDGLNISGMSLYDKEEPPGRYDLTTDEELVPLPIPKTTSIAFRTKTCNSTSTNSHDNTNYFSRNATPKKKEANS